MVLPALAGASLPRSQGPGSEPAPCPLWLLLLPVGLVVGLPGPPSAREEAESVVPSVAKPRCRQSAARLGEQAQVRMPTMSLLGTFLSSVPASESHRRVCKESVTGCSGGGWLLPRCDGGRLSRQGLSGRLSLRRRLSGLQCWVWSAGGRVSRRHRPGAELRRSAPAQTAGRRASGRGPRFRHFWSRSFISRMGMSGGWWRASGPRGSSRACLHSCFTQALHAFRPLWEALAFLVAAFLRHSVRLGTASSGPGLFVCDLLVNLGKHSCAAWVGTAVRESLGKLRGRGSAPDPSQALAEHHSSPRPFPDPSASAPWV